MERKPGRARNPVGGALAAGSLAMMVILVFLPAVSSATPPEPVGLPNGEGQLGKRNVEVTNATGSYSIRSSIVIKGVEDSFKVELNIRDFLELALKYKESSKEVEHRIDVTLKFRGLVEFDDRNGNGRYDPDEEVQRYEMTNRTLGPIEYKTEPGGSGGRLHILSASTLDQVFFVRFYMSGELASLAGQGSPANVTPSEVKFDLNIRHFPFKGNSTRLAVDCQLLTRENVDFVSQTMDEKLAVASDESGFVFSDRDNIEGAFLSWANLARVDGQDRPIQVGLPGVGDANGSRRLVINYPRGDDIFHDPKMGIVVNALGSRITPVVDSGIGAWAWAIGIVAVAGTVASAAGVVIVRDRRRFREEAARRDPFELGDYPHYRGKR